MHSAFVVSNYFRVSDEAEFARFVKKWDLTPVRRDTDRFGFKRIGRDSFGIPRAHQGPDGRPVLGDIVIYRPLKGSGFRYLLETEASRFLFFFDVSSSLPASHLLGWSYVDSASDTRLGARNSDPE